MLAAGRGQLAAGLAAVDPEPEAPLFLLLFLLSADVLVDPLSELDVLSVLDEPPSVLVESLLVDVVEVGLELA